MQLIKGQFRAFRIKHNSFEEIKGDLPANWEINKGTFRLGVYMYNSKDAWLENIYPEAVEIKNSDWEKKDL